MFVIKRYHDCKSLKDDVEARSAKYSVHAGKKVASELLIYVLGDVVI